MLTALAAAKAYSSVAAQAAPQAIRTPETAGQAPDFAQMVSKAVNDVSATSRHAETQMIAQSQGKADLVDVVTAISSAQASLETVMAVRDQVISAYKEIMAMPI